jgi:hypothetical protein
MQPRLSASTPAACGLWATSSTSVGRPGRTWKRPGSSTSLKSAADVLHGHRQARSQRIQCADRRAGIRQLDGAAQRRMGESAAAAAASPPGPLPRFGQVAEIASQHLQVGADACCVFEKTVRRLRIADDGRPAGAEDAGLLEADGLARLAEVFHVIEIDRGDDGAIGIEGVHRIEPPAQADFEDQHLDAGRRRPPRPPACRTRNRSGRSPRAASTRAKAAHSAAPATGTPSMRTRSL